MYVACNWDTISKNDNTVNTNEFVTWIINVMTNYSNIYEGFDNNFEEYFYFGYTDIFQLLASYCKIILVRLVGVKEEPNMSMFASGLK